MNEKLERLKYLLQNSVAKMMVMELESLHQIQLPEPVGSIEVGKIQSLIDELMNEGIYHEEFLDVQSEQTDYKSIPKLCAVMNVRTPQSKDEALYLLIVAKLKKMIAAKWEASEKGEVLTTAHVAGILSYARFMPIDWHYLPADEIYPIYDYILENIQDSKDQTLDERAPQILAVMENWLDRYGHIFD